MEGVTLRVPLAGFEELEVRQAFRDPYARFVDVLASEFRLRGQHPASIMTMNFCGKVITFQNQ
jgi:hypothetical protein